MILFKAISRQLADTVERSKLTVGKLEGSSTVVDEVRSPEQLAFTEWKTWVTFLVKEISFHHATQVGDEYRSLAGVIGQSKKLITKYARREFTDKVEGTS